MLGGKKQKKDNEMGLVYFFLFDDIVIVIMPECVRIQELLKSIQENNISNYPLLVQWMYNNN